MAHASDLRNLVQRINPPQIPVEGRIWMEDTTAALPIRRCGPADSKLKQTLRQAMSVVVATQDGESVRAFLARCLDGSGECLTLTSTSPIPRYHAWMGEYLNEGSSQKKEVALDIQGKKLILHEVEPNSLRVETYPKSQVRIYEFKVGSMESWNAD